MSNPTWFYTDAQQQQLGPVTIEQLQQLATSGHIQPTTLVWTEGMAEWAQADQVQGIYAPAAAPVAAAAAPVLLATGPAAPVANPYTAPGTQVATGVGVAGAYPAPFVKKTSFGLYLGAFILSAVLFAIAMISIASSAPTPPDFSEENSLLFEAETEEQLAQAQEAMDLKQAQFSDEISADIDAGLGFGIVLFLAAGAAMTFAAIYSYIILYRAWHILQPGGARTTPGAAIGFLFIPIFSLYWIFNVYVGWSTDWNRIRSTYPDLQAAPAASGGMFIAALVCLFTVILSPIGMILFFICIKQQCDAINHIASKNSLGMATPTTGTMPKFV